MRWLCAGPAEYSDLGGVKRHKSNFREKSIAELGGAETPRIHQSDKQSVTVSEGPTSSRHSSITPVSGIGTDTAVEYFTRTRVW